jgi:hypothetical protein
VSAEVVEGEPGSLVLVTDLPEETLRDCFQYWQSQGLPGVPRRELLGYLQTAAEALDELQRQYSLQHLGLNPSNLVFVQDELRIADFGLLHLLGTLRDEPVGLFNPRFAAPELLERQVGRGCDQYSLALIFQEMLTGMHPLRGQSARQSTVVRRQRRPDLFCLTVFDRRALERALSAEPRERFPSCTELVEALRSALPDEPAESEEGRARPAAAPAPAPRQLMPPLATQLPALKEIVARAAGAWQVRDQGSRRYLEQPGVMLWQRCRALFPPGVARLKIDGFRQQWNATLVDGKDDQQFVFRLSSPGTFWSWWTGRKPGLEVQLRLAPPQVRGVGGTAVTVEVRPIHCNPDQAAHLLAEVGPPVLESVQAYLQPYPERRVHERLPYEGTVEVFPVLTDGGLGEGVRCRARDVSLGGMGLLFPEEPSASELCLHVPAPSGPSPVQLPARVIHVRAAEAGGYEVGVQFADAPAPGS